MEPSAQEILEVLYQEFDQSLRRIWEKDKQLTIDLKNIHLDFNGARSTCNEIETMHGQQLETSEGRITTFKEAKMQIQKARDELKDLFELLLVDGWAKDPEVGEEGEAGLVHQLPEG
ncbi:hypothetical protein HO133_000703 [Letharia lupina]|uniref:Uncharacterized protein n=1 Tax=Letharia lupina TaxID=560253 RepID=A0A8H6CG77_9LECA|nr:uncharacterized protein HO133_000703 [Letharia lupina]KAF6222656.1 hypothetical protein HO133_000703 [Letharia lupina]